jgi:hypothetical protein
MRIYLCNLLLLAFCLSVFSATQAAETVAEFSGARTQETTDFEVEAPWLIDWRVNSEFPQSMGLTIVLLDAPAGIHAGTVVKTKYIGDGLRLMEEGGRYRFKIDAVVANWTIKVIQLSPEEASLYTPKEKNPL